MTRRALPPILAVVAIPLLAMTCNGDSALPPVADAGADRTVAVGVEVALDGSGSLDPDGRALSYAWSFLEQPDGSAATLDGADGQMARFVPDVAGPYRLRLTVGAGDDEDVDEVTITAQNVSGNRPPSANAGADRTIVVGSSVTLDGGASSDPDGDDLVFAWSLESQPDGSAAALATPAASSTTLQPNVEGAYHVRLTVSDGDAEDQDELVVTAVSGGDGPPVAAAGPDRTVDAGSEVLLDGSASNDPDGDTLAYSWALVTWPDRGTAPAPDLEDAAGVAPRFVAAAPGDYTVELTVEAGGLDDADRVTITAEPVDPVSVVYADPAGDDADPGTEQAPVRTVRRALEVAATLDIGAVQLAAGTFDAEPFAYVVTRTVSIRGAGMGDTILDAGAADMFELDADGADGIVDLTLRDLTLRTAGLALSLPSDTRGFLTRVACVNADPCVRASELLGFLPAAGGVLTLRDSILDGSGSGIGVTVAGGAHLIANSVVRNFSRGINGFGAAFLIQDSEVTANGSGLYAVGTIDVDGDGEQDPLRIRGGAWSGNEVAIRARGAIVDAAELEVTGSGQYGMQLEGAGAGDALLTDVTVTGSGASGIKVEGGRVEIRGGAFDGNGTATQDDIVDRAGLHGSGAAVILAEGASFRANRQDDVALLGDTSATLLGIEALDVPGLGAGIYANTTGAVRVEDSLLSGNNNGLYVTGSTPLTLRGVTARDNRFAGLSYRAASNLVVRGSLFRNNDRYGVQVTGSPQGVDLTAAGGTVNTIRMSSAADAWGLSDQRAGRGTADGVRVFATGLRFQNPNGSVFVHSGTHVGPADSGAGQHWRITGTNQRIEF